VRILLVNGSPRRGAANSRIVLDALRARLGEGHEYRMLETMAAGPAAPEDLDADFIVLAFPLYIDSLHSRLLSWLMSYEALRREARVPGRAPRRIGMIAVANCGFHEGVQNATALRIIENFCARAGLEWRGGVGIGTGEMLREIKSAPDGMFIKRPVSEALDAIAARVAETPSVEAPSVEGAGNLYVSHAFPWIAFKAAGHMGWRRMAKANGLGRAAMRARPFEEGARG
jgi:hypothetical protein